MGNTMLKTHDGKKIILDIKNLKKHNPGFSGAIYVAQIFPLICILFPLVLICNNHLGSFYSWLLFYTFFPISLFFSVYFWRLTFLKKNPYGHMSLTQWLISPRLILLSSLLFFINTNPNNHAYYALFLIIWVYVESVSYIKGYRPNDEEIIKTFKPRFSLSHADGNYYYDVTKHLNTKYFSSDFKVGTLLYYFEKFGSYVIVLIGPVLFIRSQLYHDNFEPRFMIVSVIFLFLALILRYMITDYYLFHRAMRLKQAGKF